MVFEKNNRGFKEKKHASYNESLRGGSCDMFEKKMDRGEEFKKKRGMQCRLTQQYVLSAT